MSTRNFGVMPRETKVALYLLWVALVTGVAPVLLITVRNWSVVSTLSVDWWVKAYWGYPVGVLLLVALGRGYGWVRWLLLISLLFLVVAVVANVGAWARDDSHGFSMLVFAEPLLLLLRIVALVLLFRPKSNEWYASRSVVPDQAQSHGH